MIQYFEPLMTAFHAEVPFGSAWKVDPEREGPMISQRWSGRWEPSTVNKSGEKHAGGVYAGVVEDMFEEEVSPIVRPIFSANRQSKRYRGDSSVLFFM
jgi:hypothetical protein